MSRAVRNGHPAAQGIQGVNHSARYVAGYVAAMALLVALLVLSS
jgi:hypothetical protein